MENIFPEILYHSTYVLCVFYDILRAQNGTLETAPFMFHEYKPEGICNLQDGAGRVGKMLYARQGKKFDYDLKQVFSIVPSSLIFFLFVLRFSVVYICFLVWAVVWVRIEI